MGDVGVPGVIRRQTAWGDAQRVRIIRHALLNSGMALKSPSQRSKASLSRLQVKGASFAEKIFFTLTLKAFAGLYGHKVLHVSAPDGDIQVLDRQRREVLQKVFHFACTCPVRNTAH